MVWQSAGGKATAIVLRSQAIARYHENPNYCKFCNCLIDVGDGKKVQEARRKSFCNKSCAAKYNNSIKPKRIKKIKILKEKLNLTLGKTKGELFLGCANWQSARSQIQGIARIVFLRSDRPKCCSKCGYDKHFQVAHIKSVSSFDESALISEINHIDNLVALCPNCHWEFDNIIR
jgi:hypothetical protein